MDVTDLLHASGGYHIVNFPSTPEINTDQRAHEPAVTSKSAHPEYQDSSVEPCQ